MKRFLAVLLSFTITIAPLAPVVLSTGCTHSLAAGGVYQGDKVLHDADLAIVTSYDVLHAYVKWEYQNRAALASQPEIKRSADAIRRNSKQWFASAHALRDAYAVNKTMENRSALNSSLSLIRAALTEATRYMTQTAIPSPAERIAVPNRPRPDRPGSKYVKPQPKLATPKATPKPKPSTTPKTP